MIASSHAQSPENSPTSGLQRSVAENCDNRHSAATGWILLSLAQHPHSALACFLVCWNPGPRKIPSSSGRSLQPISAG